MNTLQYPQAKIGIPRDVIGSQKIAPPTVNVQLVDVVQPQGVATNGDNVPTQEQEQLIVSLRGNIASLQKELKTAIIKNKEAETRVEKLEAALLAVPKLGVDGTNGQAYENLAQQLKDKTARHEKLKLHLRKMEELNEELELDLEDAKGIPTPRNKIAADIAQSMQNQTVLHQLPGECRARLEQLNRCRGAEANLQAALDNAVKAKMENATRIMCGSKQEKFDLETVNFNRHEQRARISDEKIEAKRIALAAKADEAAKKAAELRDRAANKITLPIRARKRNRFIDDEAEEDDEEEHAEGARPAKRRMVADSEDQ